MQIEEVMNLVLPYKDKLYRFAVSMLGNSFDAEDVIQELLVKVWKKKDQFIEIDNKEAWCMTVTRNLSIDKIRSRKKNTGNIDDYYHLSDQSASASVRLEQRDALNHVMELMDQLPEKQRSVMHLRDVEGYTYQEIADLTTLTVDQVKVNLFRARKTLRSKLEKLDIKSYHN